MTERFEAEHELDGEAVRARGSGQWLRADLTSFGRFAMPTLFRRCILAFVLLVQTPLRGWSQTYSCLPDTAEETQVLHDYVVRLVTSTDSATVATRTGYHLPAVAASKVTVVTTASICKGAGDAYHAAITDPGTRPSRGRS